MPCPVSCLLLALLMALLLLPLLLQINWMRYITTMKERPKFAGAVSITTAAMTLVYLCVATTGYAAFGSAIDLHK